MAGYMPLLGWFLGPFSRLTGFRGCAAAFYARSASLEARCDAKGAHTPFDLLLGRSVALKSHAGKQTDSKKKAHRQLRERRTDW